MSKLQPEGKEFRLGSENRRAERHGGGRLRGEAVEFGPKGEAQYLSGLKGAWEDNNFDWGHGNLDMVFRS